MVLSLLGILLHKRHLHIRGHSPMVIEREIAIQPENIEDRLYPIADHGRSANKPKRNEPLDIFCHMGGEGYTERVPGDLFIPEAMPRRKA